MQVDPSVESADQKIETGRVRYAIRLAVALVASLLIHVWVILGISVGCAQCKQSNEMTTPTRLVARLAMDHMSEAAVPDSMQPSLVAATDSKSRFREPTSLPRPRIDAPANSVEQSSQKDQHSNTGVLIAPLQTYYPAKELDQRPNPLIPVVPQVPDGADPGDVVVVLRLWVSDSGRVDRAQVLTASMDERFAKNALSAFDDARFQPGIKDGRPVGSLLTIEVVFHAESAQGSGARRSQ